MNKTENIKKNTTNYPMDKHEKFCKRCLFITAVDARKLAISLQRGVKFKRYE